MRRSRMQFLPIITQPATSGGESASCREYHPIYREMRRRERLVFWQNAGTNKFQPKPAKGAGSKAIEDLQIPLIDLLLIFLDHHFILVIRFFSGYSGSIRNAGTIKKIDGMLIG